MFIRKTRILKLDSYLAGLASNERFRITISVDAKIRAALKRHGFAAAPENGDTVMPALVGPISRFNAEGRWVVHRDQPKVSRYVRTIWWRWKQWSGRDVEEHEECRDICRDCYPRDLTPPPALSLTYIQQEGATSVVSQLFRNSAEEHDLIKHTINLFLELYGACEIKRDSPQGEKIPLRYVNWHFLPPGEYPWTRVQGHLRDVLGKDSGDISLMINDRQETLYSFAPDEVHVGLGGFRDYLAYVFRSKGLVVLESIRRDNALYVFGSEWKQFSAMTKADIISSRFHRARLIHSKGWKVKIAALLA